MRDRPTTPAAPATARPTGLTQKHLGAFYTPDHAVDASLALVTPTLLTDASRGAILEPSGGDGAFVRGLLRRGVAPPDILVWDLNPDTASAITALGAQFSAGDTLRRDSTALHGRCRLIVGNPPYLGKGSAYLQQHGAELARRYPQVSQGEVYGLFLALALDLLAPGGELVFVLSDTWRTLATHEPLRRLLLQHTICTLVLLPRQLFAATGASVDTCILHVRKGAAPSRHRLVMRDCRQQPLGTYTGPTVRVAQRTVARWPKAILPWADAATQTDLARWAAQPIRLLDRLEGGLGLHTRDNAAHCARIAPAPPTPRLPTQIAPSAVDGRQWRVYHKTGGRRDWWACPTTAIRWTAADRATYAMPASFRDTWRASRTPLLISGVSDRLSARLGVRGGVWNSNKCFGFVPTDPQREPVTFWLAVLNSATMRRWVAVLNHTVSLQISDLALLRMPRFTDRERAALTRLGAQAVRAAKRGHAPRETTLAQINQIVEHAAARAATGRASGRAPRGPVGSL